MGFSNLPAKARAYLLFVCLLGLVGAVAACVFHWPSAKGTMLEMGLFVLFGAIFGGKKITLFKSGEDDAVSMSLGFVITFAGMLRFGPTGAFVIGAMSCLVGCLYPKKQPTYQLLFNVSLSALEAFIGSLAYLAVNGWSLEMSPVQSFLAIVAATCVFFVANTGGVSMIIGLCSEESAFSVWKETFLWTAPSYFAGACVSGLSILLLGSQNSYLILFLAPVAYFTYQSYAVHKSRADEKIRHIQETQQNQERLADLYLATIKSLALAIDAKDQYTHQHILRVQRYAVAIAVQMGLEDGELEAVNTGALLHDIGKLGVPEYVLLKPGRLTDDEFDKIKQHPEIGAAILGPVEFPWPVLPVVKYHHEKWDGSGYPEGLKGESIPLTARIMAVADVYDALTSSRSYRNAWNHERAYNVICEGAGTHFDPIVVEAFKQVIHTVIEEMAEQGEGPMAARPYFEPPAADSSAVAARAISRTSTDLWALYEVSQSLSARRGIEETLDILAKKLTGVFPETDCLFLLKQEEKLEVCSATGPNHPFFHRATTIGSGSRSWQVVQTGTTAVGEYDPDDLVLASSESAQWKPIHSSLIVPIPYEGEVLGTINLYSGDASAFSEHDQQLLETVAERAATAIFNAILCDRDAGMSGTDPLTGLNSIGPFTEAVEQRCNSGRGFGLLCIDLDNFKAINDAFGHQKGDEILRNLGKSILAWSEPGGNACRYGGDQFLLCMEVAGPEALDQMADRLQREVSQMPVDLHHFVHGSISLEATVGKAFFRVHGTDCPALLASVFNDVKLLKTDKKLRALTQASESSGRREAAA